MGQRAPDIVARACDLGVAMQLTNIARDVGEDARAGRLYLPLSWLRDAGIDPDTMAGEACFSPPEIAAIVQRLLDAADWLYGRATLGIAHLPLACRPGIYAARALYAEIGRELERAQTVIRFHSARWSRPSASSRCWREPWLLLGNRTGRRPAGSHHWPSSMRRGFWSRRSPPRRCATPRVRQRSRRGRSRIGWSG